MLRLISSNFHLKNANFSRIVTETSLIRGNQLPAKTRLYATRTRKRPWIHRYLEVLNSKETSQVKEKVTELDVLPRKSTASRMDEIIPWKSDPNEAEQYVNTYGGLRIGKFMQDLDSFAAMIAYRHLGIDFNNLEHHVNVTIVTASVERVDLLHVMTLEQDYILSGQVTHTGKSSMEVTLWIKETQTPNVSMVAKFHMVARDKETGKAAMVPPLIPENDQEKGWFAQGDANKQRRLKEAKQDLTISPPTSEEAQIVHALYQTSLSKDLKDVVYLADTRQESVILTMPANRNLHNRIFGGFLMMKAFELAYSCSWLLAKSRPWFLSLDEIQFRKPVEIGDILVFTSHVTYINPNGSSFLVSVTAEIIIPETGERQVSNTFHFTFTIRGAKPLPKLVPTTYQDFMLYLDGRRRWMRGYETFKQVAPHRLPEW